MEEVKPTGYQVLIKPFEVKDHIETDSGFKLYMPDEAQDREQIGAVVGQVISLGSLAYRDEVRFPDGPWAQPGDWVYTGRHAGSRLLVNDQEYRLINDDSVLAVVSNPKAISRPK